MRTQLNRLIVAVALLVGLPAVSIAERLRRGAGRRLACDALALVARACGITYDVRGGDDLVAGGSYVLVPNHASPLDIPAILTARNEARFAAAAELFRIPLLAGAMRALDTVAIDRRDAGAARRALQVVAAEPLGSMVVFAEGGIPAPGETRRFHTGAFVLAIEAGAPIVPVAISGTRQLLPTGARLGVRPGWVTVELLPAIETAGLTVRDRKQLRDQVEVAVRGGRPMR